jgi:hypothetical protein
MNGFARAWRWRAWPDEVRYVRALADPETAQRRYLARWLATRAETALGRAHGLKPGLSLEEFQRRVPTRTPAEFAPWLNAVERGEPGVLTREPALALLPTSGSVGGRKLIPWTATLGREFRAALHPWVVGLMREHPSAWCGRAYWSVSPPAWPGARSAGGLPIGFEGDSAYVGGCLGRWVEATLAGPSELARVQDVQAWSYLTLAHLLRADDLSLISIWSPTFLLSLLAQLPRWWPSLLSDLESGQLHPPGDVDPGLLSRLQRKFGRHPSRARMAQAWGAAPDPARLWPHLAVISCWTDAASAEPARLLAAKFPRAKVMGKGLWATEGVVSLPRPGARNPTLALTSHLLEFVDDKNRVRTAWQLVVGQTYRVLLTTGGGLCRYELGDLIRVTGRLEACPCVEFLGRAESTSDQCGEKLTEPFVRTCWEDVARPSARAGSFALVAPEVDAGGYGYALFMTDEDPCAASELAHALELKLQANVHYAHARRLGQLTPLRGYALSGGAVLAWSCYQARLMEAGQRAGDIKPSLLSARSGWLAYFQDKECLRC